LGLDIERAGGQGQGQRDCRKQLGELHIALFSVYFVIAGLPAPLLPSTRQRSKLATDMGEISTIPEFVQTYSKIPPAQNQLAPKLDGG
jgi:hypothetical protein